MSAENPRINPEGKPIRSLRSRFARTAASVALMVGLPAGIIGAAVNMGDHGKLPGYTPAMGIPNAESFTLSAGETRVIPGNNPKVELELTGNIFVNGVDTEPKSWFDQSITVVDLSGKKSTTLVNPSYDDITVNVGDELGTGINVFAAEEKVTSDGSLGMDINTFKSGKLVSKQHVETPEYGF